MTGTNKYPDGDRYFTLANQIVENGGCSYLPFVIQVCLTILEYHDTGRGGFIVLRRYVNPVVGCRSGIDAAGFPDAFFNRALRDTSLWEGIDTESVVCTHVGGSQEKQGGSQ